MKTFSSCSQASADRGVGFGTKFENLGTNLNEVIGRLGYPEALCPLFFFLS